MDKDDYKDRIKEQIEVMEACLEGKDIQVSYGGVIWEDTEHPEWTWDVIKYRVKPEEAEESKKLMTCRQLAELLAKGYGECIAFYYDGTSSLICIKYDYFQNDEENTVMKEMRIRPWGSDEWLEPTVDIYEEYISKWNKAFKEIEVKVVFPKKEEEDTVKDYSDDYAGEPEVGEIFKINGRTLKCIEEKDCKECAFQKGPASCCPDIACNNASRKDGKNVVFVDVSKMEDTTSEDSSSTVSKEEKVGVHRRTPQEIADFFNCYVAYDPSMFRFVAYEKTPVFSDEIGWIEGSYNSSFELDRFAIAVDSCEEEYILYRPHLIPIAKKKEDRPSRAALTMGMVGASQEEEDD